MNWEKHGIDISKVRGGKGFCPKCHNERKNKTDRELSVDLVRGLFNCHHCEFKGSAAEFQKREYVKPLPRLEKVSLKTIEFFESRGISNNTLLRMQITEAKEFMPQFEKECQVICFNYFRGEELVNIKFRGPQKSFKMAKDAELVFYNLNEIQDQSEAIIVEGEIDLLSMIEAGIYNVVSVPNGASKGSQKLEYLDNCWQYFEGKEKVVICTDNDEAGRERGFAALDLGERQVGPDLRAAAFLSGLALLLRWRDIDADRAHVGLRSGTPGTLRQKIASSGL
jgi:twinkle protein